MTRIEDIKDIAHEAAIEASKNSGVAPQLLFAPIFWVLERRLDSSIAITHDDWFAWHPVCLDNGKRTWLRTVERRTESVAGFSERWFGYSYKKKNT